ncbi:hypothetical protein F5146DRAFT_1124181 [Armillaria mellea]|nr:hypothetical protein F5146DRAFT_1124181 [Armillaria mellea]
MHQNDSSIIPYFVATCTVITSGVDSHLNEKENQKPTLHKTTLQRIRSSLIGDAAKANDNALDAEGMKEIRLLQDLQPKQESPGCSEGALFLDTGSLGAATEHLTSLDKQVLDDIPSTLGVHSRTGKRKSDSSDEPGVHLAPHSIDENELANISDNEEKRMFSAMWLLEYRPQEFQSFFQGSKDIIHHQRHLIGRNTCVVMDWPGRQLVVKISYPSTYRDSEKKFVDAAEVKADGMAGEGNKHWVLDHIPETLHLQDFSSSDEDRSQRRLAELLTEAEYADGISSSNRCLRASVFYNGLDQCQGHRPNIL